MTRCVPGLFAVSKCILTISAVQCRTLCSSHAIDLRDPCSGNLCLESFMSSCILSQHSKDPSVIAQDTVLDRR